MGIIDKTILFSGRFDRPHLGHIITIGQLGQKYRGVIVCILDHPNQFYPISERKKTMCDAVRLLSGNYQIITNTYNFEIITKGQIDQEINVPFEVYGTGNWQCFTNMKNLGYEVVEVARYPGYAATKDRCFQKIMKIIKSETGLK